MAAFNTVGPEERRTAAKLEKLRKENPEEVENLLKTVNVPTTGPPNRSQWRKLELAMKFINKKPGSQSHSSPSKTSSSSRPGTPNRKSITSIDSKDHEKLVNRPLTKQPTLVSLGKSGSSESKNTTSTNTSTTASSSSPRNTTVTTTSTSCPSPRPTVETSPSPSPRAKALTSSVETNTEGSSNKKISEVQTDANAKVLLSKKVQTDISVKDDSDLVENLSPRNKKKPLKKQKSLSKITNSFGKIVTLAYDFDAERS